MRVLAVIPARGGSKGVPGKNIREVGGKPLIAWTIDAAHAASMVSRTVLSSDDQAIIRAAEQHGCEVPFVRPAHLSTDTAPTIAVVLDALERLPGYDMVVLLQPTSPLRLADDIDDAVSLCIAQAAPSCVSVTPVEESPYWMYTLDDGSHLQPLLPTQQASRRQDLPPVYSLNGAIYVARTDWLLKTQKFVTADTVAYVMPNDRSLDIDTESDLLRLKQIMEI